ncbi:MarR family transcriptional regulator [Sphingomonas sp. UNC305MFCol5.2]|uniref:MarR family transcriptional regulator n=1 Tax=Sphingomonas sp. UNC305MFCol5.2 TaxID=1449076 RepID=UPI00041F6D2A|nr:MarR family transcriptional regulator [Sphingomonas sp. UNC305MFCol5.2]
MGAHVVLSREQLLRLMQLVEAIAAQRGGDADAAISFLQDAVAAKLNKPSYKSVTQFAAGMRAIRLRRNELLGKPVFRDPAWDMLLDLVVAADERRAVSVSGLCHASGVPTTTALRHVERLETLGLLTRTPDPADKRRFWVDGEPEALVRVREIIARLQAEA